MSGHRDWAPSSEEHRPLAYWGGHPIYAAHFVVIIYCVLMIVTAIAGQAIAPVIDWLSFYSQRVWAGEAWRLFTYGLFNQPSLDFAFDMLMIVWFGRELERVFGRRVFGALYGGVYLLPTVILSLIGLATPTAKFGEPGALALFVGFATYFPGTPVFFVLLAKWAALILVGIFSLMALAARDWTSLIVLWSTCGYAHLYVRFQQGLFSLPSFRLFKRKPRLRALPDLPASKSMTAAKPPHEDATMAEIDALLDKIAKSGISSLTAKERAKLEAAREGLIKRGAGRGTD